MFLTPMLAPTNRYRYRDRDRQRWEVGANRSSTIGFRGRLKPRLSHMIDTHCVGRPAELNAVLASSAGQKGVSSLQSVAYGRKWKLNNAPPFPVFNPQIQTIRDSHHKRTDMRGGVLSAEPPQGRTARRFGRLPATLRGELDSPRLKVYDTAPSAARRSCARQIAYYGRRTRVAPRAWLRLGARPGLAT